MFTDPNVQQVAPFVRFEERTIEDRQQSIATGRYVEKDVIYVLVSQPGTKNVHDDIAEEWIKKQHNLADLGRIPRHWPGQFEQMLAQFKSGVEPTPEGIPLRSWAPISKAQAQNLIRVGILTVEQLAAVTEEGLANIGLNGRELRQRAQAYLLTADRDKTSARITDLEAQVANRDARIDSLQTQVDALAAMVRNVGLDPMAGRGPQDASEADPITKRKGKAA